MWKISLLLSSFLIGYYCEDTCNLCKCETLGEVFHLDCSNRALTQVISEWPTFDQTKLTVSFNQNQIASLSKLPPSNATFEVILSKCEIKYLESGLFENVPNVKFVDLSYNQLTVDVLNAEVFRGPYSDSDYEQLPIEHLNLAYNAIHSLPRKMFEHMNSLRTLNLEGNQFYRLDIPTQAAISSILTLEILNLANNGLTELVDDVIAKSTNLISIDLSGNDLHFVPSSLALVRSSLRVLKLDNNPIEEVDSEVFIGMENITELSINNLTELTTIKANTFVPLLNLRKLHICNNLRLTEIDPEAFRENQTIFEFYLANNNLASVGQWLVKWSTVKALNLSDNPWECTCDLYNIAIKLKSDITRDLAGPRCYNSVTEAVLPIYSLTNDVCGQKPKKLRVPGIIRSYHHISFILTCLILVLIFAAALAMHLGMYRLRSRRNTNISTDINYGRINNPYF